MQKAVEMLNACSSRAFQQVLRFFMSGLEWEHYVKHVQWNDTLFVCIVCV